MSNISKRYLNVGKTLFWTTLATGALRDALLNDSNMEVYAYIAMGMIVSLTALAISKVIDQSPDREEYKT